MTLLQSLHFLFVVVVLTLLRPSSPPFNFTPSGTTIVNHTSINLTQHHNNCISNPPDSNFGSVFYKNPIPFLHSSFNSTDSYSTRFTFTIIPPTPPCLSGEGIAFFITSDPNSLPHSIGFPKSPDQKTLDSSSFLAVEFDTKFDPSLGDINDNHVAIDVDSADSVASVDLTTNGINLKSGRKIRVWIEYRNHDNLIQVWVGYTKIKPRFPTVAAPIDLSKRLKGSMYVGFSASNGKGSSIHMINSWYFSVSPHIKVEPVGLENCLICFPEDPVGKQHARYLLLFILFEAFIELYRITRVR